MFQPFVLRNRETGKKQVIRTAYNYAIDKAVNLLHDRHARVTSVNAKPFNQKGVAEITVKTKQQVVNYELLIV